MTVKKYGTANELLFNFDNSLTLPATVDNPSAQLDENNHKIIKAGTPLALDGDKSFLLNRNETLKPNTANPDVMLLHDVNITNGPANATVVVEGDVALTNADADVKSMYTDETIKAMPKITFIK